MATLDSGVLIDRNTSEKTAYRLKGVHQDAEVTIHIADQALMIVGSLAEAQDTIKELTERGNFTLENKQ